MFHSKKKKKDKSCGVFFFLLIFFLYHEHLVVHTPKNSKLDKPHDAHMCKTSFTFCAVAGSRLTLDS